MMKKPKGGAPAPGAPPPGSATGQYVPICNPANYTSGMQLPGLPRQFSVVVEANFGQNNSTSDIREYVDEVGNRGRLEISSVGTNTVVGIFDYDNGEIYIIPDANTGDACALKPIANSSAPSSPFFGFREVGGSVQIGTVSSLFRLPGNANAIWLGVEDVRGIPCNRWQTCTATQSSSYTLDYYFATDDWEFALGDAPTPVQVILNSVSARGSLMHTYSLVFYDTGPGSLPDNIFNVPIGLVCTGRSPGRPVPPFPPYFSLTLESIQRSRQQSTVYKVSYCIYTATILSLRLKCMDVLPPPPPPPHFLLCDTFHNNYTACRLHIPMCAHVARCVCSSSALCDMHCSAI